MNKINYFNITNNEEIIKEFDDIFSEKASCWLECCDYEKLEADLKHFLTSKLNQRDAEWKGQFKEALPKHREIAQSEMLDNTDTEYRKEGYNSCRQQLLTNLKNKGINL